MTIVDKLAVYAKFVIATLSPVFLAVQAAVTDDHFSQTELVSVAVAVAVAVGVLAKGNRLTQTQIQRSVQWQSGPVVPPK